MKKAKQFFLIYLLVFTCQQAVAQKRAVYYLQNGSAYGSIQWTKMTHFVHAFFNPWVPGEGTNHNGDVTNAAGVPNANEAASPWFVTANFVNQRAAAIAANPDLKIIISVGGAPTSNDDFITDRLNYIFADATRRDNFATDLVEFVENYNLDGIDLDLEHPDTQTEKDNHQTFLALLKSKMNAKEAIMCKELELSIALNGETDQFVVDPSGSDYVNPGVDASVDFYHLMTYDASYAAHNAVNSAWPLNHSPLIHAQEAVRDFALPPFSWPKSKMVIGIPFYGRNGAATITYAGMSPNATIFGNDQNGSWNYNGCPTITSKVNLAFTEGLAGVLVWEASQDVTGAYSLTSCIWNAISANALFAKNCCSNPNIGPDRLTCNTAFPITLDANVTGGTFQWYRLLPSTATLGTAQTQSVSADGTYYVKRTINGCISYDTVVVSTATTLPTPALSNKTLCTVPYTLTPSNVNAFPTGTTFQWQKPAGTNIAGETSSTLYASAPGTYTLVATLGGCTSSSSSATITASSASPVDACRTTAGTLDLSVTGGTGPFTWYDSPLPGNNVVASNTSTYTTPSLPLPSTTYYYVEDASAITNVVIGQTSPTFTGSDFSYDCSAFISMEFDVKAPVKLKSVDVYLGSFGVTFPVGFRIEIINDNNSIVYTSAVQNYAAWVGTAQTITLNAHLPIGKYRMRSIPTTSDPSLLHKASPTFPYNSAADLTLTRQLGTPQYGPYFNWQIGDYNACPRIPVRAVVAASCSGSFLPVDLSYFQAEKSGEDVLLEWATASEINNEEFLVDRSLDGLQFSTIGRVSGAGNSDVMQAYSFVDANAPKSILYYRLAQKDRDGTISFSEIKTVNNAGIAGVSVAPNPFSNTTTVEILNTGITSLRILDVQGKVVQEISVPENSSTAEVGSGLKAGFYILDAQANGGSVQVKLVKE